MPVMMKITNAENLRVQQMASFIQGLKKLFPGELILWDPQTPDFITLPGVTNHQFEIANEASRAAGMMISSWDMIAVEKHFDLSTDDANQLRLDEPKTPS